MTTIALSVLVLVPSAFANGAGRTGSSVTGCGGCHGASANVNTTVGFDAPIVVAPGATVNIGFFVSNGAKAGAGLDVSATGGTLNAGGNTKKSGTEITHSSTTAMTLGETLFDFTWTAPSTAGTYTLRGAGNAVDGTGGVTGDEWNIGTVNIDVVSCAPQQTTICALSQGIVTCDAAPYANDTSPVIASVYTGGSSCDAGLCVQGTDAGGSDFFCPFVEADVTSKVVLTLGTLDDLVGCSDGSGATLDPAAAIRLEVHGGDGNDFVDGSDCNVKVSAFGDAGADILVGGAKADKLQGGAGADILGGAGGSDILGGGGGNDSIAGDDGNDTITGGDGADKIRGNPGNDVINAGAGNDIVCGDDGIDSIFGEGNDDKLSSGPGLDTVDGGPGTNDQCTDVGAPNCESVLTGFTCPVF